MIRLVAEYGRGKDFERKKVTRVTYMQDDEEVTVHGGPGHRSPLLFSSPRPTARAGRFLLRLVVWYFLSTHQRKQKIKKQVVSKAYVLAPSDQFHSFEGLYTEYQVLRQVLFLIAHFVLVGRLDYSQNSWRSPLSRLGYIRRKE